MPRMFSAVARTFVRFSSRTLKGSAERERLIRVNLPEFGKFADVSDFGASELAEFFRRIIREAGWKIEAEREE